MQTITLHQMQTAVEGRAHGCETNDAAVGRVVVDSRAVGAGDVFWALPGDTQNGHDFVAQAFENGAVACVVDRDRLSGLPASSGRLIAVDNTRTALASFARWHREQQKAVVIGVTGSVGKTTTREMIYAALSGELIGSRSPRNYNNQIGVPLSLLEIRPDDDFAVIELAASAAGEIRDLARLAGPQIGVITAIGPAHLEGFGSLAGATAAKGELLECLPATGLAILNGDDPHLWALARRASCRLLFVGRRDSNHLRATDVVAGTDQLTFTLDGQRYAVPTTGRHHLTSALAAVAVAREMGLSANGIAAALHSFTPPPGRCEVKRLGEWTVIDDTYNSNPLSMQAACRLLADWPADARRVLVAGDMLELGPTAAGWHREVGQTATEMGIDLLLACGRHAGDMLAGATEAGMPADCAAGFEHLDDLLALLEDLLEPGDVVLVKGSRAMRMERVVDGLAERSQFTVPSLQGDTSRIPVRQCV